MPALTHKHRSVLAQLAAGTTMPVASWGAVRVAYLVSLWSRRRHTRRTLRTLDDFQLTDIGLTRRAARDEARKWFWRP